MVLLRRIPDSFDLSGTEISLSNVCKLHLLKFKK